MNVKSGIKHLQYQYVLKHIYTLNVSTDVKRDNYHMFIFFFFYVNRSTICEDTWRNNDILKWTKSNKKTNCYWKSITKFNMFLWCKSTSYINLLVNKWNNNCKSWENHLYTTINIWTKWNLYMYCRKFYWKSKSIDLSWCSM